MEVNCNYFDPFSHCITSSSSRVS